MADATKSQDRILVIKLSALGDFIQALGPMAAIRRHHQNAHITILTTKAFEKFARQCGYFDEIWIDERPKWLDLGGWLALRKKLNAGNFERVYDFQNNDRTNIYFSLLSPKPQWVGTAREPLIAINLRCEQQFMLMTATYKRWRWPVLQTLKSTVSNGWTAI